MGVLVLLLLLLLLVVVSQCCGHLELSGEEGGGGGWGGPAATRTAIEFGEVRFWIKARFGAGSGMGRMRVPGGGSPVDCGVAPVAFSPVLGGVGAGVGERLAGDLGGLRDLSRESLRRQ